MDYNNYTVTVNKHGVEITTTERFGKPYYFLTYNPGGGELWQVGTDDLGGVAFEDLSTEHVLDLMGKEY